MINKRYSAKAKSAGARYPSTAGASRLQLRYQTPRGCAQGHRDASRDHRTAFRSRCKTPPDAIDLLATITRRNRSAHAASSARFAPPAKIAIDEVRPPTSTSLAKTSDRWSGAASINRELNIAGAASCRGQLLPGTRAVAVSEDTRSRLTEAWS